jgi:polyferredoxin
MGRLYHRRPVERTLLIRRSVQAAFVLLNVWIGIQFYLWVRFYETAGASVYVMRPPGVEGWLPIAAMMNLKHAVLTGEIIDVHPAGLFLLAAFLGISILFRKAFCSWICPIGTLSEWLWMGGRDLIGQNFVVPRWLDIPLRSLKYILMALFVWVVVSMSTADIATFLTSPYGIVADVKMLDFFRHAGRLTLQVCLVLVVLSVVTKNVWCRYLCPYGALMGLASLFSPARITRDPVSCIDCGKCATACPSLIPVDRLMTVRTPECNGCLTCVSVCPVKDALEMRTLVRRRRITAPRIALGVVGVFLLAVAVARFTGHWAGTTPEDRLFTLIPNAAALAHPR